MPVITPQQQSGPEATESALLESTDTPEPTTGVTSRQVPPTATMNEPAFDSGTPRRRRRWWIPIAAVGAVAIAGGVTAVATGDNRSSDSADNADGASPDAAPIRAVQAETIDLAEFVEVDGTLSFSDPTTVSAAAEGVVTGVAAEATVVDRGDVVYEIDTRAVVALWGDTPLYRTLERGVDDGRDVQVLEENLAALGYTDDGDLVVDQEFDSATRDAVIAWQYDNAIDGEGVVQPSDVVVLDGPAVIDSVETTVGASITAGSPVVAVTVTDVASTVLSNAEGRITAVASAGQPLATGDVVYEVDTVPTVVILGDVAFERELLLGVEDGDDVQQLEQALADLGFDAAGELIVDEEFDQATATAVADWQTELGRADDDGSVQVGEIVVVPAGSQILSVDAERGDDVTVDSMILSTSVSTRQISGTVDTGDVDLIAIGNSVQVEFADGTTVDGTIATIDTVSTVSADGNETSGFTVTVAEIPASVIDAYTADVTISITSELVEGATVVPASALVSVGDGTYAVEVVEGNSTTFVAVTPGLFADGNVQVDGIEPGTAVVVPE